MKKYLREKIKKERENLNIEIVMGKSIKCSNTFFDSNLYQEAKTIMSYVSIKNEVDTSFINRKILENNKILILPVIEKNNDFIKAVRCIDDKNMKKGTYGISEPINEEKFDINMIDIVIVPAVAYDKRGYRIGFGKGYYDKFLKNYKGIKIGLGYDFQLIDNILEENHDIKMDYLIIEDKLLECK